MQCEYINLTYISTWDFCSLKSINELQITKFRVVALFSLNKYLAVASSFSRLLAFSTQAPYSMVNHHVWF